LEENSSNFKIRKKLANSLLEKFYKSILNLRKEKSAKYVIFGNNPK
jgi:hypothetical protein